MPLLLITSYGAGGGLLHFQTVLLGLEACTAPTIPIILPLSFTTANMCISSDCRAKSRVLGFIYRHIHGTTEN
jgi:hypothetical protein